MKTQTLCTWIIAAAAALLALSPATSASAAEKRTVVFKPAASSPQAVTFRVRGVQARHVVRASLVGGGRLRRIGRVQARQAARRGVLRVQVRAPRAGRGQRRMGRLVAGASRRRGALSVPRAARKSLKLKVVTKSARKPVRSKPAVPRETEVQPTDAQPTETQPPAVDTPAPAPAEDAPASETSSPATATETTGTEAASAPAAPAAPAGEKSTTRPVGTAILSDAEAAARVRRSSWEPRPANAAANQRTPQPGELDAFLANNISVHRAHKPLVTGNFTGTTDEIIQWAAWKWGLDEDILRAVIVKESWWRMSAVGDNGLSFGLTQIKTTFHAGTHPLSNSSTAFNVDYYGALFRYYYDGHARWLNDMDKGSDYAAGDLWGAIGAHYAGRWHTPAAEGYITDVKRHLDQRTWTQAGF